MRGRGPGVQVAARSCRRQETRLPRGLQEEGGVSPCLELRENDVCGVKPLWAWLFVTVATGHSCCCCGEAKTQRRRQR